MNSLDKRIAALEVTANGPEAFDAIVRVIISPDNPSPDINRVRDHHGGEWVRMAGETAQELRDRAIAAARLTTKGMPKLIASVRHSAK